MTTNVGLLGNAAHTLCESELHLSLHVRAHTRLVLESPLERNWAPASLPQWTKDVLVIDCETTVGLDQKLNFGFYRWSKLQPDGHYACLEEGIFHRNDLGNDAVMLLRQFAHTHKAHVAPGNSTKILVMSRDEFVDGPLWDIIMAGGGLVGYNLPFDISRLAHKYKAAGDSWSFIMHTYKDHGAVKPDKFRPRITIRPMDSHRAFCRLTGGRPRNKDGKPMPCRWPVPKGRFLDVAHMVFALRNKHLGLNAACNEYKVKGKLDHEPTGQINPKEIAYARQDVAATLNLLNAIKVEFDSFGLSIRPEQVFSSASLTKGFLKDMGLIPPKKKFQNVPDKVLGCAAQSYFGGRTECRVRHTDVPGVLYDVTSEYPTMAANLGVWNLIRAREVRVEICTEEVKELLSHLTLEELFNRNVIRQLAFFAKIKPRGALVPCRAKYDGESATIGINHLYSEKALWLAGPDLATAILDGPVPEVLEAFRLIPEGVQTGLKEVRIGKRSFDPTTDDFFTAIIEERQSLKRSDKCHPHVLLLKIVANAFYGCFAELNSRTYSKNRAKFVEVFSGDDHFVALSRKVEIPGRYSFIPAASLITSGGRLMLAMAERLVRDAGTCHAMMDTDSMFVIANQDGGLVPCESGLERLPDGHPAVRALSWQHADELFKRFDAISPYDPKIIPHLFRKEDVNFSADGGQVELRYFGIASKRYVCFRGDPRNPRVVKPSQHGVGCYFKPDKRKWVKADDCTADQKYPALAFDDWKHILKDHFSNEAAIRDGNHPFLNHFAMRRVRVNTPRELAVLRKLDPDKARPFNFCISPVLVENPFSPKEVLIAPFNSHPEQWPKLRYVNKDTGKLYRLHDRSRENVINGVVRDDPNVPMPQLYGGALFAYQHHKEMKYPGGDGAGVLGRWKIHATGDLHYLGKEVERKREGGDDLADILMEPPLEYKPLRRRSEGSKSCLHPAVIDRLKGRFSIKKLARKAKLDRDVIRRAFRSKLIRLRSWRLLMRVYEGMQ